MWAEYLQRYVSHFPVVTWLASMCLVRASSGTHF